MHGQSVKHPGPGRKTGAVTGVKFQTGLLLKISNRPRQLLHRRVLRQMETTDDGAQFSHARHLARILTDIHNACVGTTGDDDQTGVRLVDQGSQ